MIPSPPSSTKVMKVRTDLGERGGYLSHRSELLHFVEHRPTGQPRGHVLLAGPLPDERTHTHLTWVRWSRFLAQHGFLVLRFDYSGTGESTGLIEQATLTAWSADLAAAFEYLNRNRRGEPMILHGLRLGGLLATRSFHNGPASALLTWEPTMSGDALLVDAARRQQAANLVQGISGAGPGPRALASRLDEGETVSINGYPWSPEFWSDARGWYLSRQRSEDKRPSLHLRLRRHVSKEDSSASRTDQPGSVADDTETISISWPPFWMVGNRLVHQLDALFQRSLAFIEQTTR